MTKWHERQPSLSDIRREIGRNLEKARMDAGMTVESVGIRLGWPREKLVQIERGERDVYVDEAAELAALYGIGFGRLRDP